MKFFKLLKKEIRDIMTLDSLIGIIVGLVIFLILGNVMGTVTEELTKKVEKVAICDLDKSKATEQFFSYLQSKGVEVVNIQEGTHVKMLEEAEKSADISTVMVIKKGFQDEFLKGAPPTLEKITRLKSFATLSDNDVTAKALQSHLDDYFEITLDKMVEGTTVGFLKNPYKVTEVTVVGQKSEYADSSILKAFGMQQSIFIPIIVFMLITTATQLNCSSIANEKTDKTLETLLSTPISRISVLAAKMTASAVYSLLMAGVFILGFSTYMGKMTGMMGEANGDISTVTTALNNLGITLNAFDYVVLGVQLFLTIAIALTISIIIGALAKDLKATQGLITPLMLAAMIPYFITIFTDIGTLPTVARIALFAIPFTHTYQASANIIFGNTALLYGGLIYQIIFLAVVVYIAVRVFSSDKIFTMTLGFKKKVKK